MLETHFKEWRIFAGLSQPQLAYIMGLSKPVISRIEVGLRRWHADFLEDFTIACNIHPADVFKAPPNIGLNGHRMPDWMIALRRQMVADVARTRDWQTAENPHPSRPEPQSKL